MDIHPSQLQGFDVLLHAGTLMALIFCYWKLWWRVLLSPFTKDRLHQRLLVLLVIATIPAAIAGVFLESSIETLRSPNVVAFSFLITSLILIGGESRRSASGEIHGLRPISAFIVGIAQSIALVPGLSRSGLTISAGRYIGLSRKNALDFSFLMAAPIIAGATILTIRDFTHGNGVMPEAVITIIGILSAFGASVLAITFLRQWVERHSLSWFALYLVPLALLILGGQDKILFLFS
jgi:undecaprenyl-diphosphatase